MPNRTVYLPELLDAASRQLGLNLSQLTQRAIQDQVANASESVLVERCAAATARIAALDIQWSDDALAAGRREAGER